MAGSFKKDSHGIYKTISWTGLFHNVGFSTKG